MLFVMDLAWERLRLELVVTNRCDFHCQIRKCLICKVAEGVGFEAKGLRFVVMREYA